MSATTNKKGKLLVLGGTGFLGQAICKRALVEGYQVTSISRRGIVDGEDAGNVDYRKGDARQEATINNILNEGGYTGVFVFGFECCGGVSPRSLLLFA